MRPMRNSMHTFTGTATTEHAGLWQCTENDCLHEFSSERFEATCPKCGEDVNMAPQPR